MQRLLLGTTVASVIFAGSLRADDVPALPKKFAPASWAYAKAINDADGNPLLKRYRAEARTVKEMRTVTRLVKETRVVEGQSVTLEIPRMETVPVDVSIWIWKAEVASFEDPRLRFFDMTGKGVDPEKAWERLATTTIVKWADEQPDSFFLSSARPETLLIVAPDKAFAKLPGVVKEPLPDRGCAPEDAFARISTAADGSRQIELLLLGVRSPKAGEKIILPKWSIGELPVDHPAVRIYDLQGKQIEATAVRMEKWTAVLLGGFSEAPHPLMVNGVKEGTLRVATEGPALHNVLHDLDEPRPQPKPRIDTLPLPPLPPRLPLPVAPQPKSTPTDPRPASADPQPMIPAVAPETKPEAAPAGGPPVDVVKKMLEVQWGPLGRTTRHQYDFKSIRFGPPQKEVVTVNGQGQFTGKVRYPVRVLCDITVRFADGTSRMETKHQTFHFFLDNFNEWSFRFIENN